MTLLHGYDCSPPFRRLAALWPTYSLFEFESEFFGPGPNTELACLGSPNHEGEKQQEGLKALGLLRGREIHYPNFLDLNPDEHGLVSSSSAD